jgi:hypothetical protein
MDMFFDALDLFPAAAALGASRIALVEFYFSNKATL